MPYYLSLDGIDDYLSSSQVTINRIVMEFSYESNTTSTTAYYLFDARNGSPHGNFMVYIYQNKILTAASGIRTFKVDGVTAVSHTLIPDTRYTIDATFSSNVSSDANGIQFFVNYINQNTTRTKGKIYRIMGYKGENLQFDYDMTLGNVLDQSNQGNHATLTGGDWVNTSTPTDPTDPTGPIATEYGYVIELDRWGISNNFTNANATIDGINSALQWAYDNGIHHVLLPKGNYLLNVVGKSIHIQSHTITDLGGSHLRVEPNGEPNYAVITALQKEYATVRNGIIQGDRYEHDYTVGATTHEWGIGVLAKGQSKFITIENMEVYDTTGDGIDTEGIYNQLAVVYRNDFEPGFIHPTTGTTEVNTGWVRSKVSYNLVHPLIQKNQFFGFYGNGYGHLRFNGMRHYNVYFYKSDGTFIKSIVNQPFYEPVNTVVDAAYVRIAVRTTMPDVIYDRIAEFRCHEQPTHIMIRNNHIYGARRCGMALGEGRYIVVENNIIHDIEGTAPQSGIDIEDGNWINQHYTIRDNQFYNNRLYDIILYSGRYMTIENNSFRSTCTINGMLEKVQWSGNKFEQTRLLASGECLIDSNYFYGSYLQLASYRPKQVNHCMFHNSYIDFVEEQPYVSTITGCKFYVDQDKILINPSAGRILFRGAPVTMIDCEVDDGLDVSSTLSALLGIQNGYIFNNVTFRSVSMISLPSGEYTNCRFIDTPSITKLGSLRGDLILKNCYMKLTSEGFLVTNVKNLTIVDSEIHISNTCRYALRLGDIDKALIQRNTFYGESLTYFSNVALLDVTNAFIGNELIIEGNKFNHNNGTNTLNDGIRTTTAHSSVRAFVLNNILTYCGLSIRSTDLSRDNIINGVTD